MCDVFLSLQTNPYYVKPRVADHQFGIKHYAGEVITSTSSVILACLYYIWTFINILNKLLFFIFSFNMNCIMWLSLYIKK